ncbi:MAG: hypothetical protein LBH75_07835 [Treponema sp.]|jgi:hypothetical protein|nr:hypothetical protein [Treponema sp.]
MSKENNNTRLRMGVLIPWICAFLLNACDRPLGGWEYQFTNQTRYTISITISERYKLSLDENATWVNGSVNLYAGESKTLYGVDSDSVDFRWTASTWSNNRYIYPVPNGSKVTFKERQP